MKHKKNENLTKFNKNYEKLKRIILKKIKKPKS